MMNVRICTLTRARLLTQHASVPAPSWLNFIISIIHRHSYARMLRSSSHTCNAERYFSLFQFQELSFRVNVKQHGRFVTDDYACLCIGCSLPFQLVTEHRWGPAGARKGAGTRRYGNTRCSNIHAQFMPTFCSSASALLWPLCSHCMALQTNVRFGDRLQVDPLIQNHS